MTSLIRLLRRDAPLAYGTVLALTGMADGFWQGAYAWFLSARMGFTPSQVGVVIGSQFILQIILEVPSGAWADRGHTKRVLAAAYASFIIYCAGYFFAGDLEPGALPLAIAIAAEAFFGIGSALVSGTLDAWICERERAATDENEEDFARRLGRVHSISQLWGAVPCAIFGTLAFVYATRGHPDIPWLLGGIGYLLALAVILIAVGDTEAKDETPARREFFKAVGEQIGRSIAYLHEQPQTLRLFFRSAVAFMPFFATQVFWIPFLAKTLFVGRADSIGIGNIPIVHAVPLIASLWGAGEMARSLGGSLFANPKDPSDTATVRRLALVMSAYTLAICAQVAAVLLDWHELQLFALGYLLARFAEGRARLDIGVLRDKWIMSDRATLQSLDSFVKSIVGLIYITTVGSLMQADPILGYLVIAGSSGIAAYLLARLMSADAWTVSASVTPRTVSKPSAAASKALPNAEAKNGRADPSGRSGTSIARLIFQPRYIFFAIVGLVLVSAPALIGADRRPLWSFLNEQSADGAVVEIKGIEEHQQLDNVGSTRTRWLFTGGLVTNPVGCRTLITKRHELWNDNIDGRVRARLHAIGGDYYLEYAVNPPDPKNPLDRRGTTVTLSPDSIDVTTCFRLKGRPELLEFDERRVIPARVTRLSSTVRGSSMILPEMIVGFVVICLLIGAAVWEGRNRLQELLALTPGTVLDRAREHSGSIPYAIMNPKEGLPTNGFGEFNDIIEKLGATSLIMGGFSALPPKGAGRVQEVNELWLHEYGEGVLDDKPQDAAVLGWILGRHPEADGADARGFRLEYQDVLVSASGWPVPAPEAPSAPRAPTEGRKPRGVLYAAAGMVRRERRANRQQRHLSVGFAIAVFGRDSAPRYVAPVERQVLRLLADLARMQGDRAQRNVSTADAIHWAKTILDMIRMPMEVVRLGIGRTVTAEPDLAESHPLRSSALTLTGVKSRIMLGKDRIAHRLTGGVDLDAREPRILREDLPQVASHFTFSQYGKMTVNVDIDEDIGSLRVDWQSWLVLEGALFELLWNAGKHGCTREHPDVEAYLDVRLENSSFVSFTVRNRLPSSVAFNASSTRGFGLQIVPLSIHAARGFFRDLSFNKETCEVSVGFTLSKEMLEGGA